MGIQRHSFNSHGKNSNAMIHLSVKMLDGESVEAEKKSQQPLMPDEVWSKFWLAVGLRGSVSFDFVKLKYLRRVQLRPRRENLEALKTSGNGKTIVSYQFAFPPRRFHRQSLWRSSARKRRQVRLLALRETSHVTQPDDPFPWALDVYQAAFWSQV